MGSVLVIDDDADIRGLVGALLERAGHRVVEAEDGRAGLKALYGHVPDLVILDVTMPELDGWATLERIRDLTDVPVLMLTAHDAELERVRGLKAGADDYVVKPFGRQELVARVDALLRRAPTSTHLDHYDDGAVSIDHARRLVICRGLPVSLTPLEFRLLDALTRHAG